MDDVANDLIEEVKVARDMKKILDRKSTLGNKDYDLDFLVNQFENLSLDIKTNPSVFFITGLYSASVYTCVKLYVYNIGTDLRP